MLIARVREIDCVGCGKCLDACPVDAIVGAPKFMHTVLDQECIGCKLCVSPCPMDCIEMFEETCDRSHHPENAAEENVAEEKAKRLAKAERAKMRYQAKTQRLIAKERLKLPTPANGSNDPAYKKQIQAEIHAAVARVSQKRKGLIA